MANICAVIVEPQKRAYVEEISACMGVFESIVGGSIEFVRVLENCVLICNTEVSKILGRTVFGKDIYGTFLLVSMDKNNSSVSSLLEDEIEEVIRIFSKESINRDDFDIMLSAK